MPTTPHTFHIPVMGLGFTIDTALKVAKFGISSVLSIVEDELIEQMREFHSKEANLLFVPIGKDEEDFRAKRITAYLNLLQFLVEKQVAAMKELSFNESNELTTYFDLLPDSSPLKHRFWELQKCTDEATREKLSTELKEAIIIGAIDVNIMAKIDKTNYDKEGNALPKEFSDALAALRGFANSNLRSSVVLSAGYNPQLYAYAECFPDFYPNSYGILNKKIILKVSDYRSALTQGKLFAKKGIWVSEFRIESGLNCGGHAFATDGVLLGPILEEFKTNRTALLQELFDLCNKSLIQKGLTPFAEVPYTRITVQGGIGTALENEMLLAYYEVDGTGWGSPFLLVPEATNVDSVTLAALSTAKKEDYFLSNTSPLGVPFNNFRSSSSEALRKQRIANGKPGSPCTKKNLISNCEFSEKPICTASIKFQTHKIKELKTLELDKEKYELAFNQITDKDCLCEGLSNAALLKNNINPAGKTRAIAICPGPNLAYFSGVFSLKQMISHIYGKTNLLNEVYRPHMFINELSLYVEYLEKDMQQFMEQISVQKTKYYQKFSTNVLKGIDYYKNLFQELNQSIDQSKEQIIAELEKFEQKVEALINTPQLVPATL